ncbi:MAG: zf-HC2 domain-containing protein [Caldilineaceae bacterium]|nr:zf-HC2 domain-containing protein [Caldilineaceae bacterium]
MTGSTQSGAPQPCQALCAQLSGYLDGEVAAEVCAAIDAHLATCPDCRVVVNTLDRTVRLYRGLPAAALPTEAAARLYAVLDLPAPP